MSQFSCHPNSIRNRLADRSYEDESGCYIWEGSRDSGGYGQVSVNKKLLKVHRVAWLEYKGPIPLGINVLHKCDVCPCWNPEHLFLGNQQDNVDDMIAKGRAPDMKGIKNGNARLNETEVIEVLKLIEEGLLFNTEIARQFDVAESTIRYIKTNGWKNLKEEIYASV